MRRYMSRIALLLSVLMLQFLAPYDVMALDSSAQKEEPVQNEQLATELTGHEDEVEFTPEISALLGSLNDTEEEQGEHPGLLFELSDKRCEVDSKHFMGDDRTFTAVKYPFSVHYRLSEDGEYIDIDNRLYEKAAETEEEILLTRALAGEEQTSYISYFPASSPVKAAISPDTEGRYLAAIENDGHILSWNYEEVHEGLYMEVTEGRNEQEEEPLETDPEVPVDDHSL